MFTRHKLHDLSPMAIKQINDNFSGIFMKLSGNIDTIDMRDGAVTGNKIKGKTITGDHILEGTITINNLAEDVAKGFNLLENPHFQSLSSDVEDNTTIIQQNSEAIKLQANHISTNTQNIADLTLTSESINATVGELSNITGSNVERISALEIKSDSITLSVKEVKGDIVKIGKDLSAQEKSIATLQLTSGEISANVSTLSGKVGMLSSDVSIMGGQISSKVSYTDFTGNSIVSRINQTADSFQIDAQHIDLRGITTVYSSNGQSRMVMGNNFGDMAIYHNSHKYFSTYYSIPGVNLQSGGDTFMSAESSNVYFPGNVTVDGVLNAKVVPVFG